MIIFNGVNIKQNVERFHSIGSMLETFSVSLGFTCEITGETSNAQEVKALLDDATITLLTGLERGEYERRIESLEKGIEELRDDNADYRRMIRLIKDTLGVYEYDQWED